MVTPLKLIQGTTLTAAAVLYYTAPAGVSVIIKKITIQNVSSPAAHNFAMWLVPAGQTWGTPFVIADESPVGALETVSVDAAVNQILMPGDSIWAGGDDNVSLQIQASGVAIVTGTL